MAHLGSSGHWSQRFYHLDTDACCDSLPVSFDSGLGLESCPSLQSGNISSIQNPDQLISTFDRLQVQDSVASGIREQQHNLSLVNATPVVTPEFCEFFQQNEEGDTMLHITIIQKDLDLTEKYINVADDPNLLSIQNFHYFHTPLHLAVITNRPDIVRLLVVRGAALWKQDHEGNTPLHLACKLGFLECLRQLTAPLSEQELYNQRIRTVGMMTVEQTASIKNYEGETCLHVAQNSSSPNRLNIIMFLLLSLSLDVNMQEGKCGYTILHQAIKSQDIDLIKALLIQPSIDVNRICYNGRTALSLARCQHLDQVIHLLLARGAVDHTVDDNCSSSDSDDDQIDGFDDLMI